jgi:hypothetical protein
VEETGDPYTDGPLTDRDESEKSALAVERKPETRAFLLIDTCDESAAEP